ncbi:hypothetical protein NDU88_002735 [Pleurodeles waltl]|uniref:Uncharacterized protein n=1 Tax=Pleurodeles waltl TaxID=8319 RepID=A0AAV7TML5_PLEWA|nr:hypothetical protein NDU88_002735 [Pleurodeles waltl]
MGRAEHGPEACGRSTNPGLELRTGRDRGTCLSKTCGKRRAPPLPSALAAAITGIGAEWPTPRPPAAVCDDRSPLGLGRAENGTRTCATRNKGEPRHRRHTFPLLGPRGWQALLGSPDGILPFTWPELGGRASTA